MVGYRYLILSLTLLLFSCAQVGRISGGEKDTAAPRPVEGKVNPPNGTTRFMVKEVEIPFNEFFRLNNPNTSVKIVPAHATVQTRVKGKSLFLSWEEDLEENTTYAIYLNNTVKDITEGNDSIIQYAFSTGDVLDTLSYAVPVADARTGKPLSDIVLGLYDPASGELRSFSETNASGYAVLRYLKAGEYNLLAFKDENNDLEIQEHEAVGFPNTAIRIDSAQYDSIPLRLFTPMKEPEIRSKAFVAPGIILLGTNVPFTSPVVSLNGAQIDSENIDVVAEDSLRIFINAAEMTSAEVVLNSPEVSDTVTFRFSKSDKDAAVTLRPSIFNGNVSPWDSLSFVSNSFISTVDTSLIEILNPVDSLPVLNYEIRTNYNEFTIHFHERDVLEKVLITMSPGAVKTWRGQSKKLISSATFLPAKKYGSLAVDLSYYGSEPIILSLLKGGKAVRTVHVDSENLSYQFEGLEPGEYAFMVILDENKNGRWDVGDLSTKKQPEKIDFYSNATKVRANWDVEISLVPNNE